MHQTKAAALMLFLLSVAVAPPAVGAAAGTSLQSPEAIVDSVLEAYGGMERLGAVDAYRLEAKLDARARGTAARAVRISAGPDRLQVMITYPDGAEIRMIDEGRGYSGSSIKTLTPAEGPALAAMRLQAARAHLPWILHELREQVLHVRTEGPFEVLELRFSETEALRLLIDTRTFMIMTTESMVSAGPMDFHFRTEFSDFRQVEGVTFAFHEENFAAGTHTASTTVETVQLNPPAGERTLR